jgi:hypothetical protein
MHRSALVRLLTLVMAVVHTFPARKHLAALVAAPSVTESWKGIGALAAIAFYLLPVRMQARIMASLWRDHRWSLRAAGLMLAAAHLVPAWDHLPRFVAAPSWYDGWRGLLTAAAVVWFVVPLPQQAVALAALARIGRIATLAVSRTEPLVHGQA